MLTYIGDEAVQGLIEEVRGYMSQLFKICEAIAMLDMVSDYCSGWMIVVNVSQISAFAQLVTTHDYVRPHITDTLAIRCARHPIREKIMQTKFIPNDVYSTQQSRFQIITGCNMSGKSTYIRSIALLCIMAQIGSFVPANYASFPILHQLFARLGLDDNIETNVSTFAAEMREIASILRNIDKRSLAIVDELGRGTSTRDGLAIALAIAEALVESRSLVWFATHFRDIATILAERNGVVSLHLTVEINQNDTMTMLYKVAEGAVQDRHYGLALARVVPLPDGLIERATDVAQKLERQVQKRKKTSLAVIKERRRKLILNLKEHLVQAHSGVMEGEVLTAWLKELQREFVSRMTTIDAEAARAEQERDSGDDEDNGGHHGGIIDQSGQSDVEVEIDERPPTTSTHMSERTVVTLSSRATTTESESTMRAVSENER